MVRLLALLLFGYCAYRIANEFTTRLPKVEPVALLPSPERQKHDAHIARRDRLALRRRS